MLDAAGATITTGFGTDGMSGDEGTGGVGEGDELGERACADATTTASAGLDGRVTTTGVVGVVGNSFALATGAEPLELVTAPVLPAVPALATAPLSARFTAHE